MQNCPIADFAIVGGGYTGAMVALHLLRTGARSTRIAVIEPRAELGAGVAYSARRDVHRINVPAQVMACASEPGGDFLTWLMERHPELLGPEPARSFVPRRCFGWFVRDRLDHAAQISDAELVHHRATAIDLAREATGFRIDLADGQRLAARQVVLCASFGSPAWPSEIVAQAAGDPRCIGDPWMPEALAGVPADASVLVIGTGLTMADIVAELLERAHRGPIIAFSRHGRLPQPNLPCQAPAGLDLCDLPLQELSSFFRALRALIARADAGGGSWRDIFEALRQQGTRVWWRLSAADRRRVLRHCRSLYDTRRYRMAPELSAMLDAARGSGQLQLVAARLQSCRAIPLGIEANLRAAPDRIVTINAQRVVNCTGPRMLVRPGDHGLLGRLAGAGLIRPDGYGFGIEVDPNFTVIGADGPVGGLYAVGPLTRGQFGDVVGSPEILRQAERLAREVAQPAGAMA